MEFENVSYQVYNSQTNVFWYALNPNRSGSGLGGWYNAFTNLFFAVIKLLAVGNSPRFDQSCVLLRFGRICYGKPRQYTA